MLLALTTDGCGTATDLRSVLSCRGRALLFVRGDSENLKLLRGGTSKHSLLLVDIVWVHTIVNVMVHILAALLRHVRYVRLFLADENVAVGVHGGAWHTNLLNFVHSHVKGCSRVLALWSLTGVLDSIEGLDMRCFALRTLPILVKIDRCDTFVAIIGIGSDAPSAGTTARKLGNRDLTLTNDAISWLAPVKVYIEAIDTGGVHVGGPHTLLAYAHHSIAQVLIII